MQSLISNIMKKFFIITNEHKDMNLAVTNAISDYIIAKGGTCTHYVSTKTGWSERNLRRFEQSDIDADCIIVLGGDGTLVRAARDMASIGIPLIGVNMGTLGYLCELERSTVFDAIDKLFNDQYELEERMLIAGSDSKDATGRTTFALNDIVISRVGPPLRVVGFNNYVNDGYLNSYNADGIIIATPTGSTGYSLSCGGPIIAPNAAMTVMTPIAPHTLNTRSLIFPEDDVITVELGEGRRQIQENGLASFDGDVEVPMSTGDRIVIKKASVSVKILKLNHLSFVEVLRQKMSNN